MKNKKGQIEDIIFIIVTAVLVFTFLIVISLKVATVFNDKFQASDKPDAQSKSIVNNLVTRAPKLVDGIILVLFVFLMFIGLILALQIPSNPVWYIVSFIYFLIISILSRIIGILYERAIQATAFSDVAATLPITTFVITKLHIITIVFAIITVSIVSIKK